MKDALPGSLARRGPDVLLRRGEPRLGCRARARAARREGRRPRRSRRARRRRRRRGACRRSRPRDEQRRLRRHPRQAARSDSPPSDERADDRLPPRLQLVAAIGEGQLIARAAAALAADPPRFHVPALAHRPGAGDARRVRMDRMRAPADASSRSSAARSAATTRRGSRNATARRRSSSIRRSGPRDLRPFIGPQRNLHTGDDTTSRPRTSSSSRRSRSRGSRVPSAISCSLAPATKCSIGAQAVGFYAGAFQYVAGGGDHGWAGFRRRGRIGAALLRMRALPSGRTFDVAVIGGGLVGAAVAFGLRSLGPKLALLDEGDVAYRAARANFGLVWVQGKGAGLLVRRLDTGFGGRVAAARGRASARVPASTSRLRNRAASTSASPQGSSSSASPARRAAVAAGVSPLSDRSPRSQRRSHRACPVSATAVAGGTYCPLDGPLQSAEAPARAARGDDSRGRRCIGPIIASRGSRRAARASCSTRQPALSRRQRVVLAAGLGNAARADGRTRLARAAPIRAGHRARARPAVSRAAAADDPADRRRHGADRRLAAGPRLRRFVRHRRARGDGRARCACFPALGGARVVRAWAGLRVMTPDGFPVYEQSASHPGAFVASCHSGVTLAAAHAYALAPAVAGGGLPTRSIVQRDAVRRRR